jgi:hypothetical protein
MGGMPLGGEEEAERKRVADAERKRVALVNEA